MNQLLNHKLNLAYKSKLLTSLIVLILFLIVQSSYAAQGVFTSYIGIDTVNHTAYIYNENFVQYPINPENHKSSVIDFSTIPAFWSLAQSYDVVRRNNNGSIDVLSSDPAYSEMVHHVAMLYSAPNRPRNDPNDFPSPFSTGSELTSFFFPNGYGYKLDSGYLILQWHWENPANVATTENIYLRVSITVDNEPNAYINTNVDEIDVVPVTSTFTVPPGKSKKSSPKYPVYTDRRIVAVLPHIHDHGSTIKLKNNQGTIRKFKPEYQNIPVAHDDMGQGATLLHSHKDHLPVNGLYAWTPGKNGPVIRAGDSLWVESEFNNPHPRDIDNMIIGTIFWEPVNN